MSLYRGAIYAALVGTGLGLSAESLPAERLKSTAEVFDNKSAWDMYRNYSDDSCAAFSSYTNKTELMLIWRPRKESLIVTVHNPTLEAIKEYEKYEIEVYFNKGNRLDDGWGKRNAFGSKDSQGIPGFVLGLKGGEALADLSTSNRMHFWYKDKLVTSVDLKGSSLMVSELQRCSKDIVKNHPIDPFEE